MHRLVCWRSAPFSWSEPHTLACAFAILSLLVYAVAHASRRLAVKAAPHPRALTVAHAAWLSTAPSPEESAIAAPRTWRPCPVSRLCALFVDVRRRRICHHDVLPQVDDLKLVDRMLLTARKLHRVVPSPRELIDRGEGDPVDKLRQLCRRPATEARTAARPKTRKRRCVGCEPVAVTTSTAWHVTPRNPRQERQGSTPHLAAVSKGDGLPEVEVNPAPGRQVHPEVTRICFCLL